MSVCSRVHERLQEYSEQRPSGTQSGRRHLGHVRWWFETGGDFDATIPDAFYEDPNAPKLEPEFVMNQVELLPLDEGFDLNEDGQPNNALSLLFSDPIVGNALGGDPNEYIARTVRRGEMLLLLDFRNLNDFESDQNLHFDIFLGGTQTADDGTILTVTQSSTLPAAV